MKLWVLQGEVLHHRIRQQLLAHLRYLLGGSSCRIGVHINCHEAADAYLHHAIEAESAQRTRDSCALRVEDSGAGDYLYGYAI